MKREKRMKTFTEKTIHEKYFKGLTIPQIFEISTLEIDDPVPEKRNYETLSDKTKKTLKKDLKLLRIQLERIEDVLYSYMAVTHRLWAKEQEYLKKITDLESLLEDIGGISKNPGG